jgi:hypothetical protein
MLPLASGDASGHHLSGERPPDTLVRLSVYSAEIVPCTQRLNSRPASSKESSLGWNQETRHHIPGFERDSWE